MSEIADTAQVTKGALYHHFASKEALYLEMMLVDFEQKRELMHAAVVQNGSCYDRLYSLTMSFLDLPDEKRRLMKLVRRDINIFKNPIRNQLVRAYQAALPNQVEAIIHDGIEADEIAAGDARLLAWHFVAMVEVILTDYAQQLLGDKNQMANYVIDLFFAGAGKKLTGEVGD